MKRLLIAAALALASPAAQAQNVNATLNGTALPHEMVTKAFEVFVRVCKPLNQWWGDVETVTITTEDPAPPFMQERGWNKAMRVAIKVRENPRWMPASHVNTGPIGGHTLHYAMGGGTDPGISGSKRVRQFLCGMPINSANDTFLPVPELASVITY